MAAYKNQRERIEHLEAFINRFRAQATKAKQVQSRIKELEKIERIEIPQEEQAIHFKFPQPQPSGRMVAEFKDVAKSYGPKRKCSATSNFVIERGDRIALVGVNGAGKSTLIKLLSGVDRPDVRGTVQLGHNVEPDYFAQDQYKELDTSRRVLEDLETVAPLATTTELRNLLGCFLFSGDDVFKPIGVLSGGERNRYALARMLLHPSNFLLLDEPTNHLDLRAKDVLLNALEGLQRDRDLRVARSLLHRQAGDEGVRNRGRDAACVPGRTTKSSWGGSRNRRCTADTPVCGGQRRAAERMAIMPIATETEPPKSEAHQSHQAEADAGSRAGIGRRNHAAGRGNRRMRNGAANVCER